MHTVQPKLVKIPERTSDRFANQVRSHWKIVGSAGVLGIGLGFVVAAVGSPSIDKNIAMQSRVQHSVIRSTGSDHTGALTTNPDELSRLKARNRRLEALVEILRTRVQRGVKDNSHIQDTGTELGQ